MFIGLLVALVLLSMLFINKEEVAPVNEGKSRVVEETVDGYRHLFLLSGQLRIPITKGNHNNTNARFDGRFIAWTRQGDASAAVYRYDTKHRQELRLTPYGVVTAISVANGRVAWEDASFGYPIVQYFDGQRIQKASTKQSEQPFMSGDELVFIAQTDDQTRWNVERINFLTQQRNVEAVGFYEQVASPRIIDGRIEYGIVNN